jgi:hypothetical protein
MKALAVLFVVFMTAIISASATAIAPVLPTPPPLVLYDDFHSKMIDPTKWIGEESNNKSPDSMRGNANKSLRMLDLAYGVILAESDAEFMTVPSGGERLIFKSKQYTTAIQTTMWADTVSTFGGPSCSGPAKAKAQIGGHFFNDGSGKQPSEGIAGDATGDVGAVISLERSSDSAEPKNILHVKANVFRCTDAECKTTEDLQSLDFPGKVKVGQKVKLTVWWDQTEHKFHFQKDKETPLTYEYISLQGTDVADDTDVPVIRNKGLQVHYEVPNCSAAPSTQSYMAADFDNVYLTP